MPKRLAITIAGAVSLGSFEAGVIYEIIHALDQHNNNAAADDRILIDVLTGASAGGMTAAVTAQKLIFDSGALTGPYENILYKAWVQDIDISELLKDHPGDSATKSIFSSGYVEELSRRYITSRYGTGTPPVPQRHSAAAEKIWLGLALSNLNGVDYGLKTSTGDFTYTHFQDSLLKLVENSPAVDTLSYWETIRSAAVSCGAFPFAFRPVEVVRYPGDYTSPNLESIIQPGQGFCYSDGGTFQNQPLGMAKHLVDVLDPTHVGTEDRYYLFVSPHDKKSVASIDLNANNADFIPFAKHLFSAIYNQSQFQDWITAEDMNRQIGLLDERAEQLRRLLADKPAEGAVLQPASSLLLSLLFPGVDPQSSGSNPINAARERLKKQYAAEYDTLPEQARSVFIDSVLVLEKVAHLGEKDEMKILSIIAKGSELAGADLQAFGGFFDFKYRKHDYDVGRFKAQNFLTAANCPLGRINYVPEQIAPIDKNLDNLRVGQMDEEVRKKVYDRFKERLLELMATEVNAALRLPLYYLVVGPKLKKALGL